jgi:mono/diheme cytochrome c family protein
MKSSLKRTVPSSGVQSGTLRAFLSALGAPPPSALARRLRASLGPQALRLLTLGFCLLMISGCRQDMHNQPKYRPLRASGFFDNGSSARPLVDGTVARGTLQTDDPAFFTGKVNNQPIAELPFPVTSELVDRGQQRFNIYCTPCHDATGSGNGMVVQRGLRPPPSFHIDRLRQAPAGHFFDTITNGFGAMPDYRAQIVPRDRWAIVAYIRALQLSQHATTADIGDPAKLSQQPAKPAAPVKH